MLKRAIPVMKVIIILFCFTFLLSSWAEFKHSEGFNALLVNNRLKTVRFSKHLPQKTSKTLNQNSIKQLNRKLKTLIKKSSIAQRNLGLAVSNSGRIDFGLNENKLFIPASLSKIITSSALFEFFHPSDQFETLFLIDNFIGENGVLKGNLYLKGGGDPSFVSESLWNLVNHLTRTGLKRVEGNLIVDDFLFEEENLRRKGFSFDRSYNAPLSALSFNWNSMSIYIRPGKKVNQPAFVFVDPKNSYIQLKNKVRTKGSTRKIQISLNRKGREVVSVRGSVPLGSEEFVKYRSVSRPALYAGWNALEFLKRRGIAVSGTILRGKTPNSAVVLAKEKGRSFSRLIQDMMKYSSNFITGMLVTQLSVRQGLEQGSSREGMKWIDQFLKNKGIRDYHFDQPAGLSRKNKLRPKDILTILQEDLLSPYVYEKLSSYPLAGGTGTLEKRFMELPYPFFVRAKTGRLSGVEGLAGYIRNQQGRIWSFVFIYNGSARRQDRARALFDNLVITLVNNNT